MKLFTLATYIASATALGINCRGSTVCSGAENGLQTIHEQISDMVNSGNGGRWFNEGDMIACYGFQTGSICAFYQKGASGTAQQALDHVQKLLDHGCRACGSDPTQDGNNVNAGELTVNAAGSPCCVGTCQC
ncbi:hypothetical protein SEPCBS119000_003770 [Sporothrix epigloea]|uniref:Killer toxin Kp4 domain-containing protein n=1 Tax=Sporothrix epigloea TaxID=1892477 RepID=A0ABP0DNQ2_9PEZI